MSVEAVAWAWAIEGVGSSARKFVLLALCNCHNPTHGCFPSQRYISSITGMSERAVRGHLKELESNGFIRRVHRGAAGGAFRSDEYQLAFEFHSEGPSKSRGKFCHAAKSAVGKNVRNPAAKSAAKQVKGKVRNARASERTTLDERAAFWAKEIKADRYVPPSAVSTEIAARMIDTGMVERHQLRAAGIAC